MRKFALKFYLVSLLFLSVIAFFAIKVAPNVTGDIGLLGLVPYGKEYTLNVNNMVDEKSDSICVTQIHCVDSISYFPIITIGDSFSNLGLCSYPHFLGRDKGLIVGNIERVSFYQPLSDYVALLNMDAFCPGQVVVVETSEHDCLGRLEELDFSNINCNGLGPSNFGHWDKDYLYETMRWIRLRLGYNNPVSIFPLSKECFSHPSRSRELHTVSGELSFSTRTRSQVDAAMSNLDSLFIYSAEKGVKLLFLIAADKYDSYEPWIDGAHEKNDIFTFFPKRDDVTVMLPYMRELISNDVLDVYQVNDVHCSTIGASMMADVVYNRLTSIGYLTE